jgi:ABC-2 type transport system ATP-binding protein
MVARGAHGSVDVSGKKDPGVALPAAVAADREREVGGPDAVIEVSGLRMSYDGLEAVRGIDLRVRRGEIFTFLGPNGAGKTTTVEILEGHRRRTGGNVQVLGADPEHADRSWRARVGVVLQTSRVEQDLTVRECLELYAGYYPAPRSVSEVIKLVGLKSKANARGKQLSGGQQRRMDVALALIGDPELVFMDEPTTGFDPSARRAAWEMIDGLRELGKTIFLTTLYMDEAEALADRIAVLSAGRIVAEGTPGTLGGRDQGRVSDRVHAARRSCRRRAPGGGGVGASGRRVGAGADRHRRGDVDAAFAVWLGARSQPRHSGPAGATPDARGHLSDADGVAEVK